MCSRREVAEAVHRDRILPETLRGRSSGPSRLSRFPPGSARAFDCRAYELGTDVALAEVFFVHPADHSKSEGLSCFLAP
jgi:hypothetical protein